MKGPSIYAPVQQNDGENGDPVRWPKWPPPIHYQYRSGRHHPGEIVIDRVSAGHNRCTVTESCLARRGASGPAVTVTQDLDNRRMRG